MRPIAFFLAGAAIVFAIDLAPPDESSLAFLAVVGLAFAGGLLATSRIDLAALVIGSAGGGLLSALFQFGSPDGPSSVESAVAGIAFVAVVMWFVSSYVFGLRARLRGARAPSAVGGAGSAVGGAGQRRVAASAGTHELRPNTLSVDLVPNRLGALGTGKTKASAPRPPQGRSPRG